MAQNDVLQEISNRHYNAIKILRESGPRPVKGLVDPHHLAMAKESCEAISNDFINSHYDVDTAPTIEEMETIEKTLNDKVKQFQNPIEYTLLPSTNEQFQFIVQPYMYKIRKAFEGFKPKSKIGF